MVNNINKRHLHCQNLPRSSLFEPIGFLFWWHPLGHPSERVWDWQDDLARAAKELSELELKVYRAMRWEPMMRMAWIHISNIINMFVWILKTCFKVVSSFEKPNWTVQSFFQIGAVSVWQQVVEKESALAQDESDLIEVPMLQHWRHEWAIVQCGTG